MRTAIRFRPRENSSRISASRPTSRDAAASGLRCKQVGNKEAVASIKARAQERAENLRAIVADVRNGGHASLRDIAAELNRRAILTPRGGEWHTTSVVRLLEQFSDEAEILL
jgi:hypothetical protein